MANACDSLLASGSDREHPRWGDIPEGAIAWQAATRDRAVSPRALVTARRTGGAEWAVETGDVVCPAPRETWHAVVEADPDGLVTQTPAWLDSITAAASYRDASRLYDFGAGRQVVVPLVERVGFPVGLAVRESYPGSWGIGGAVAPGGVRADELAAVIADLARRPGLRTHLRPNPLHAPLWAAATSESAASVIPRRAHVLELSGGFGHVWDKRFSGSARTGVRRAERSGLTVEQDTTGRLMPVFYGLFEVSLERWARRQHEPRLLARWRGHRRDSRDKLLTIARTLGNACRVWVAWHDGHPAAAIIVLQGHNAHYTRGVMDETIAAPTHANDLLNRRAIEEACEAGCRYYHMGETGTSTSLARYKSKFGAEAYDYAEYAFERLPVTSLDRNLRRLVKGVVGFKEAN